RFPLLPVEDEGRLNDPKLRENFIQRLFIYKRWQDVCTQGLTPHLLIEFHTSIKFILFAHNPECYKDLGRLIAKQSEKDFNTVANEYIQKLMDGAKRLATAKKNANVLQHIMGYFKKYLNNDEKKELLDLIENYRNGYIPLIVPITLINHYTKRFDITYLKKQVYLNPYPLELMLRNHV
ncbi:MAG: DUF1722 domain-containing protein, partial [Thermodesulfovibrionales bacterium]